ncbi:MAG: hypothetical protein ACYDIE_09500 [Candidatus Krumholzibacteriia bacterium]
MARVARPAPPELPGGPPPSAPRERLLAALLLATVFAVHALSPIHQTGDSTFAIPTASSLIRTGNIDIDEYADLAAFSPGFAHLRVGSHLYNAFPLGTSLLAAPFVLVADGALNLLFAARPDLPERIRARVVARVRGRPLSDDPRLRDLRIEYYETAPIDAVYLRQVLEVLIASFLVALAAVVLYRLARRRLGVMQSLILILLLCFGTSIYSTASRGLWQHGPSVLLLALALLLLDGAPASPRAAALAALPLAFAYIVRPTNIIPLAICTLYVWRRFRPQFRLYAGGLALVAIPFIVLNLKTYGSPLPPYYSALRLNGGSSFPTALAANLVSPSRGLLVYTPILVFAGVGFARRARQGRALPLEWCAATCLVLHWLAISAFPVWWGGACYGPRFFTDLIPLTAYLLIPEIAARLDARGLPRRGTRRETALNLLFATLALFGVFVHARGAISREANDWSVYPVLVNTAPERVWDWRDPQFLRGLP